VTRRLLAALLALPLFLATSCIEGEEEIWINLDASGHLVARYEFPALALGKVGDPHEIVDALNLIAAKEEGIAITKCTFAKEGSKAIFRLEGNFDNVLELFEIADRNEELFIRETGADPDKIASVAGAINFRLEGLRPTFDREVSPSEIFPEFMAKSPGMLGPSSFKYTIHLPAKVHQTNAHTISEDGKTVSWSFLLKDHFDKPMAMALNTKIPVPWWAWLILVFFSLLVFWLVWRFLIRRFLFRPRVLNLPQENP